MRASSSWKQAWLTLETDAKDRDVLVSRGPERPWGGMAQPLADRVYPRVLAKLEREPAEEVAGGMAGGSLPPFIGIRIKPLSGEQKASSRQMIYSWVTSVFS